MSDQSPLSVPEQTDILAYGADFYILTSYLSYWRSYFHLRGMESLLCEPKTLAPIKSVRDGRRKSLPHPLDDRCMRQQAYRSAVSNGQIHAVKKTNNVCRQRMVRAIRVTNQIRERHTNAKHIREQRCGQQSRGRITDADALRSWTCVLKSRLRTCGTYFTKKDSGGNDSSSDRMRLEISSQNLRDVLRQKGFSGNDISSDRMRLEISSQNLRDILHQKRIQRE